jgi:hypothetical protein
LTEDSNPDRASTMASVRVTVTQTGAPRAARIIRLAEDPCQ